jgi:5,6-dimethylbenzimidazole synthase
VDIYEAIEKRQTIRVFKGPATDEQLKKIILAGTKAPSARNTQPWEFVIVEDQTIIDEIADIKYRLTLKMAPRDDPDRDKFEKMGMAQRDSFRNASILAVCHREGGDSSSWLCIENISLAAAAEGLGSGIVFYAPEERAIITGLLGFPSGYHLAAILKIGVPAQEGYPRENNPYGPRRPEFSWLHKNRFTPRTR